MTCDSKINLYTIVKKKQLCTILLARNSQKFITKAKEKVFCVLEKK